MTTTQGDGAGESAEERRARMDAFVNGGKPPAADVEPKEPAEVNVLVATVQGPNGPGQLATVLSTLGNSMYSVKLIDMTQYVLDNHLVLSVMMEHDSSNSISLLKELMTTCRSMNLKLDFSFTKPLSPDADIKSDVEYTDHVMSVNIAVRSNLPVKMMHDVFGYFSATKCKILQIEHRRDDRLSSNNDCTKISMRVKCPIEVQTSTLYFGLNQKCAPHAAKVLVREWNGMDKPNGKSLVLFGLSDVLCPTDVLDNVLSEAKVDPASIKPTSDGDVAKAKVQALKGKDASCMRRAAEHIEYTPGARFVCHVLKEMGFKLAVLTNTGCSSIVQAVKKDLQLDHAISRDLEVDEDGKFTGEFAGDHKVEAFVKEDYLQLLAEKERIDYRNVIIVGSFGGIVGHDDVESQRTRILLDTYGPVVSFHAPSMRKPNLTILLYLLGFSGADIAETREKRLVQMSNSSEPRSPIPSKATARPASENSSNYILRVRSDRNDVKEYASLLTPLLALSEHVTLSRFNMVTLAEDTALLGIDLAISACDEDDLETLEPVSKNSPPPSSESVLKELLFAAHQLGFHFDYEEKKKRDPMTPAPSPQRYVITVVERPTLAVSKLAKIFKLVGDLGFDNRRLERLSEERLSALQITAYVPAESDEKDFQNKLLAISKELQVDIAFQRDGIERWNRRIVVFDMDSTLIQQEVIDELAKLCGVESVVGEITERAMRGELDFHQSLKERVKLLAGNNTDELFGAVKKNLVYTTGAVELCTTLKRLGYKMAVISGGFLPMAKEVQKTLGLDYAFANTLETKNGLLTGQTVGPVVTPQRKQALLSMIAQVEGCAMGQTIAVGDGSNDIPMLTTAGLGVAFCAKPKVQDVAEFRVNNCDLSTVLFLIGISEGAARRLLKPSGHQFQPFERNESLEDDASKASFTNPRLSPRHKE